MVIFVIPFAGGSSYSFQQWRNKESKYEIIFLDFPGKGKRTKENFANSMDKLVEDIYFQILNYCRNHGVSQYMIWGHSMGGCIAYEVVLLMLDKGDVLPKKIIISSTPPPSFDNRDEIREKMHSKDQFLEYVSSFGLVDDIEVLKRPVFQKLLNAMMADYYILSQYVATQKILKDVDGIVIYGKNDTSFDVNWEEWTKYFNHGCLVRGYPGGHFFIFDSSFFIDNIIDE